MAGMYENVRNFSWLFINDALSNLLQNYPNCKKDELVEIIEAKIHGVFALKMWKPDFCEQFVKELELLESQGGKLYLSPSSEITVKVKSPNSMNKYGMVLNDLDFKTLLDPLFENVFKPLADLLFSNQGGNNLQHYYAFTVRYAVGEDVDLKIHQDDSDITFNICLGKKFKGSKLYFKGLQENSLIPIPKSLHRFKIEGEITEFEHEVGTAFVHLGKHIHGARPIEEGERVNLIVWCKIKPF